MKLSAGYRWMIVVAVVIISFLARADLIAHRPLAGYLDNEDSTSHVLATCIAYSQTPFAHTCGLPIFTMGGAENLWINDLPTASAFDKDGHNFYTSFPPGSFLFARGVFSLLGVEPSPPALRFLSGFLGICGAGVLALAVYKIAGSFNVSNAERYAAASIAFLIMFAAPESLKSYTISYWGQQVYQPLLVTMALLVAFDRPKALYYICIALGPLFEWTAYTAAFGAAVVWILRFFATRQRRYVVHAMLTLVVAGSVGIAIIGWNSSVLGLAPYMQALGNRSKVRSAHSPILLLAVFWGYVVSLQTYLVLLVIPLREALRVTSTWRQLIGKFVDLFRDDSQYRMAASFIVVLCAALLENLAMANHAYNYTYDRLKFVALVAYIVSLTPVVLPRYSAGLFWGATACSLVSIAGFFVWYEKIPDFQSVKYRQYEILGAAIRDTCPKDTLPFANAFVRGAQIYYADRNCAEVAASDLKETEIPSYIAKECRRLGFSRGRYYRVDEQGKVSTLDIDAKQTTAAAQ